MKPHDDSLRRFRKNTKYPHHRSDGLTWRRNKGSLYQAPPTVRRTAANPKAPDHA